MNYTTLEQSKKLVGLGIEPSTADMSYLNDGTKIDDYSYNRAIQFWEKYYVEIIPCWSLSALLKLMPIVDEQTYKLVGTLDGGCICEHPCTSVMFQCENALDAVFEMIVWLKERKYI